MSNLKKQIKEIDNQVSDNVHYSKKLTNITTKMEDEIRKMFQERARLSVDRYIMRMKRQELNFFHYLRTGKFL